MDSREEYRIKFQNVPRSAARARWKLWLHERKYPSLVLISLIIIGSSSSWLSIYPIILWKIISIACFVIISFNFLTCGLLISAYYAYHLHYCGDEIHYSFGTDYFSYKDSILKYEAGVKFLKNLYVLKDYWILEYYNGTRGYIPRNAIEPVFHDDILERLAAHDVPILGVSTPESQKYRAHT